MTISIATLAERGRAFFCTLFGHRLVATGWWFGATPDAPYSRLQSCTRCPFEIEEICSSGAGKPLDINRPTAKQVQA
jgi:hypothetical protein